MATSRSESWWGKDIVEKDKILECLWIKIKDIEPGALEALIDFIVDLNKNYTSKTILKDFFEKVKVINSEVSLEQFQKFFSWLSPLDAKLIDLNVELGVMAARPKELKEESLVGAELERYLAESKVSVSITLGNVKDEVKTVHSPNIPSTVPFAIHSVAKIFTGVLALRMVQEGVIKEEDLKKPLADVESFKSFLDQLPEPFQTHLREKQVTLFQLMTHMGGVGDYMDTGVGHYREALERGDRPDLTKIKDFLNYAEKKAFEVNEYHYSNVGITLVGLAIESGYASYRKEHPLDFNEIMGKYIINEAKMTHFSAKRPDDGRFNLEDEIAGYWVGGPAVGYWSTTEDLANFARWVYDKCQEPHFKLLVEKYGEEFYRNGCIVHPGTFPSSSAFLSVSLETGNMVAVLSDRPGDAVPLGVEIMMGNRIFKPAVPISSHTAAATLPAESTTQPHQEEVKDVSQSSISSRHSSRSVITVAPSTPGYPRAHQNNMSVTRRMDSDPSEKQDDVQDDARSKSSLRNPFATPTLKPPGAD